MAGRLLFLFLIVVAFLMIVQVIFGVFSSIYWSINEFLFNSKYGFIAIIFLGLSAFFFYASSRTYPQVRTKGRVIDVIKPLLHGIEAIFSNTISKIKDMRKEITKKTENTDSIIDLSNLNLESMVRKLAIAINSPNPVFFKGWGNKRLELDVERVHIIKDYIDAIRLAGDSFTELQADAVFSYEKIEELVKIKRFDLKKLSKKGKLDLDFMNDEYAQKYKLMKLEIEDKEEDVLLKRANRLAIESETKIRELQAEAEYKLMIAKGTKEEQIAEILSKAVKYYKDLPNILKSYVAVQLGTDTSQVPENDLELQDKLKTFVLRKHEAETRKLEYEADEDEAEKNTHILKLEREKKKYSSDGNV